MATSAAATPLTFTIPANASEPTSGQDLGGAAPLRLYTPSALETGTVSLGFKVSYDNGTYYFLRDDAGNILTVTVDPASAQAIDIPLDPHGKGYGWFKPVLMDSTPAAKTQTAERTLVIEVR